MSRLRRWELWMWTCITALLPLGLSLLIHRLARDQTGTPTATARELLFFALFMCNLTLTELRNVPRNIRVLPGYESAFQLCVLVIIAAAVLYGAFLVGEVRHDAPIVRNAYYWSMPVAVAGLAMATAMRAFMQRGDSRADV